MTTRKKFGSKVISKQVVSSSCYRTRSDQDENWDENGDDDWDDAGMMHSGLVGFLWQQLIKREGVYGPPGIIQMALLG